MAVSSSQEWRDIFYQARDIAGHFEQDVNTGHILLALFVVPNKAAQLLEGRNVYEDQIVNLVGDISIESSEILEKVLISSERVAVSCRSTEIDSLHLLIAISRSRTSIGYKLLSECKLDMSELRNQAMSYLTGRVRWRNIPEYQFVGSDGRPFSIQDTVINEEYGAFIKITKMKTSMLPPS